MSWTLTQQPASAQNAIIPAYNNIVFKAVSNLWASGYTYTLTLYVYNGAVLEDTIILTKDALTDGSVFFEVERILENYVDYDWSNTVENFSLNPNCFKVIGWNLELTNTSGTLVEDIGAVLAHDLESDPDEGWSIDSWGDGATAYLFTIHNAVVNKRDWLSYSPASHTVTSANASTNKFQKELSNLVIDYDQHDALYLHSDLSTDITETLRITTYNSAGTQLKQVTMDNPNPVTTSDYYYANERFIKVPSGTQNLNLINNILLTGDTQPLISASTASYKIEVLDGTSTVRALANYTITENCSKYPNFRLHWLNRLGGFDAFNFSLLSRTLIDIERTTQKQSLNRMISGSWTYAANSRTVNQLSANHKYKYVINSNWITEAESETLLSLFTSPVIYLERDYNDFIAVNLNENNYEIKTKVVDDLIQLSVTIIDNFEEVVQRG